ncbi:DUF3298 and DUF4163 domain-containing protein [Halobacillus salinus]|uniref:DUF3298 domain-containing protein n=1 Tax=Halobacillus salinus TaxID=192814 RepID=A0A4Z0H479_9BACI|nr:DUF3298 and DUF4163 domain-containing protein [Halobacillus salinus]TGB04005.1 DUF3298 domain-containing protein [Halobacillus salinus]
MKRYVLIMVASLMFLQLAPTVHAESLFQIKRKDQVTQDWEIHVDYPLFDQLQNKELQDKVNNSITSKLDHQFDMVKQGADETNGAPILYYEESDVYAEEEFYSVVMTSHLTTGNEHTSSVTSVNFENGKKSDLLPLKEMVHMDVLNKEVRRIIAQDPETYLTKQFKEVREDTAYYIEEEHLVLVFNKFEIAAGVHGTPQIQIPLDRIEKEREDPYKAPIPSTV